MRKYIKRLNSSIDEDYFYYLGKEGIYTVLFGHKPKGYKKAIYIWKTLLKQYYPEMAVETAKELLTNELSNNDR